jgi:hypothetical protein
LGDRRTGAVCPVEIQNGIGVAGRELVVAGDARLVVDTRRQRLLLDGVELVKLGENGYKLLLCLARKSGVAEMVPTRETDKAISPARQTPGATRHAVHKLRAWIEGSFAEAGLVRAVGRKGWTLTVKAAVS